LAFTDVCFLLKNSERDIAGGGTLHIFRIGEFAFDELDAIDELEEYELIFAEESR